MVSVLFELHPNCNIYLKDDYFKIRVQNLGVQRSYSISPSKFLQLVGQVNIVNLVLKTSA